MNESSTNPNASIDRDAILAKYEAQQKAAQLAAQKKLQELSETKLSPTPSTPIVSVEKDETPQATAPTMKDKIAELEKELGMYDSMPTSKKTTDAKSFLDEFGDETFYVENISNGHVVISDIDMPKIPRGGVYDLLKFSDIETLKKSRDLRTALSGYGSEKLLRRLTPEEYIQRIEREVQNRKRIEQYRQLAELRALSGQTAESTTEEPHRPIIDSKLEKLRLGMGSDPTKGISPVEFMEWVRTEKLSLSELDYILGSVQDKDIRMFILEKKKQVMDDNA